MNVPSLRKNCLGDAPAASILDVRRMPNANAIEALRRFEIPGRVTLLEGNGDLAKVEVNSDTACAEVYLHGAHVTGFQASGHPPLLFTSQCSRFAHSQPI